MKAHAEFDLIVYGATGFTGQLVAEHLTKRYGFGNGLKWAMAGRDANKLARVRDDIGAPPELPLIIADSRDTAALRAMADRTKIVVTTVGPYQLYGNELIEVCAQTGTGYLDLAGESLWMQTTIAAHDAKAKRTGACILHSCGFDSIPFELGVYYTQKLALEKFGTPVPRIKGRVRGLRGGLSGGTAYSGYSTREAVKRDPSLLAILIDPFALTPGFRGPNQPRADKPEQDDDTGTEVVPFMMAPINSKNIHRSNMLQNHAYGIDFVYDEMVMRVAGSSAEFSLPEGDKAPKPGEGPAKEEREAGFYDVLFIGIASDGRRVRASVYGRKDPGYGSTSMILAETAICLLENGKNLPGGISLPAATLGDALIDRLQANAGLSFQDETV